MFFVREWEGTALRRVGEIALKVVGLATFGLQSRFTFGELQNPCVSRVAENGEARRAAAAVRVHPPPLNRCAWRGSYSTTLRIRVSCPRWVYAEDPARRGARSSDSAGRDSGAGKVVPGRGGRRCTVSSAGAVCSPAPGRGRCSNAGHRLAYAESCGANIRHWWTDGRRAAREHGGESGLDRRGGGKVARGASDAARENRCVEGPGFRVLGSGLVDSGFMLIQRSGEETLQVCLAQKRKTPP